jgi:hypothetical protein
LRTLPRARAIEYEIVSRNRVAAMTGLPASELEWCLGDVVGIAVVKCADRHGARLTALGDPQGLHDLLLSDEREIVLATSRWPIVLRGWLPSSRVSSGTS